MLLRQKAIAEGGMALVARTALFADLAGHADDDATRKRAQLLLDLLTPIAKSFPAERGFEANALALQVHGGYGYSSEQLPEAWLRDQKLNSIHEGTTGIHGLDLLGRKVVAQGGEPIRILIDLLSVIGNRLLVFVEVRVVLVDAYQCQPRVLVFCELTPAFGASTAAWTDSSLPGSSRYNSV